MKLYHGTNSKYLKNILKRGISPRKNKESNWKENKSHPDMVYLSTAYPFYFSYCSLGEKDTKGVVFEIDTDVMDEDLFYPDEDFIWQTLKLDNKDIKLEVVKNDIENYKRNWKLSLDRLGNCCYRGVIPVDAIIRHCQFDIAKLQAIGWSILDPSISILNYMFCKEKYHRQVSWFFGDVEEFFIEDGFDNLDIAVKRTKFWEKESKNRNGIEVIKYHAVS